MLDVVADLHLHGPYSRAVSPQMTLSDIAAVAVQKGLNILATGDWTHPLWFTELRSQLVESEEGLYQLKNQTTENNRQENPVRFLLSVEIATIFSHAGKGRRVHNLVFVPSFASAAKVNKELLRRGCTLSADGRPIIGLSSHDLLELILGIDERSLLIPAHVWTPWFGIYGQMSGFSSLTQAFGDLAPFIYGIETGLSSDPEMNWQVEELKTRSILSFSDAHSLPKMGREATVFRLESLSYENIRQAIMAPSFPENKKQKTENSVLYTIEFYPEEGKYHYSGHRKCHVSQTPMEQQLAGNMCPVCGRKVTDGVLRRVEELSQQQVQGKKEIKDNTIVWIMDPTGMHPPFIRLVPLLEIVAEALQTSVHSKKAQQVFDRLCAQLHSELFVLLHADIASITTAAAHVLSQEKAAKVAEGVKKVREAQIVILPGYDGLYGTVKIWPEGADVAKDTDTPETQLGLDL